MQRFFNEPVDWPVIFVKWLPDVVQEAGVLQRCPSCTVEVILVGTEGLAGEVYRSVGHRLGTKTQNQ